MTIPKANREDLYRFIWKQLSTFNCELKRVGGISNHVHMFINLHPTVALAVLMKNVKGLSSRWMRSDPRFIHFKGWADDYYACTVSPEHKNALIEYIKGQEEHHYGTDIADELKSMYRYADLIYDERDMA
ncbi:MAG: transposase [Muribaculum sp.]|nr:transposase [Muribaculum sp.]